MPPADPNSQMDCAPTEVHIAVCFYISDFLPAIRNFRITIRVWAPVPSTALAIRRVLIAPQSAQTPTTATVPFAVASGLWRRCWRLHSREYGLDVRVIKLPVPPVRDSTLVYRLCSLVVAAVAAQVQGNPILC